MQNPYRRLPIPFSYVLLASMVFSLLVLMEDYTSYLINQYSYDYSWFTVSTQALSTYFVWALASPIASKQARILQIGGSRHFNLLIKALLMSLVIALLHRFIYQRAFDFAYFLNTGFMANPFSEKSLQLLGTGWLTSFIQYWIILMLFFTVIYYREYLNKQKELNQAQLQALKMQLHPHFLFNTLHSISALIDIDKKSAQKMVSQLGRLMRDTLEQEHKSAASVLEEIQYIKNYLDIEHVRFQDRLKIKYEIEEKAEKATIPHLILQPLVENAVKHGIQDMPENGHIHIQIKALNKDQVEILVVDNGITSQKIKVGKGIGLNNVKNRLEQFYNGNFSLVHERVEPNGFMVRMIVPYIEYREQ